MNILITGGAGFIGSSLVDRLLNKGHEVVCIDNFEAYYPIEIKKKNIDNALQHKTYKLFTGDITDKKFIDNCFKSDHFELVIHLAAKAGVRPSIINPASYFMTNVDGTLNILDSMKNYGVKRMIFASSSSVYGNNQKVPFSEEDNVDNPISPYAASKKSAELLCHTYHHLFAFDIFCLRFFTVYGPRQRPDLAIHKFTNKIINDEIIEIYGDGSSSRDYTYIDDIIDGIELSMNKLKGFDIINLGESRTISIMTLINVLETNLRKKARIEYLPLQPGDVEITYADITKAINNLGYMPKWSFDDGIIEFLKWKSS